MSEVLIEHPIPVIDQLLKLRMGDEGRLLYLRKAITTGKTIHESDKNYLKKMEEKIKNLKSNKTNSNSSTELKNNKGSSVDDKNPKQFLKENKPNSDIYNDFDNELNKIKNSILEVQNNNEKIQDNLQLLILNREVVSLSTIEKTDSFSNLSKTYTSEMFDSITNNPVYKNLSFFGIKKHDALTYASAGLFALWYTGYQNVIDLGGFQGVILGLSAGAAVSAGLSYKKYRKSKKQKTEDKKL